MGVELPGRVLQAHTPDPGHRGPAGHGCAADAGYVRGRQRRFFGGPGFPEERIVSSIVALESFIFGSAYDVTAPADIFDPGSMAESTPNFTAAVRSLAEQGHEKPADVAFSLGLEALISGLGTLRG